MSSTRMQMTDKKYLSKMIQMIMLGLTSVAATTLLHAAEETTQNNAEPLALPTLKFTANQLGEITENSGVLISPRIRTIEGKG